MGGTLDRAWEWGVGEANETVEAMKYFGNHQLIEGSRVDCTLRITDHNVARRIAHRDIADDDLEPDLPYPRQLLNLQGRHRDSAFLSQLLSQFVGYYCHHIQQDNIGTILPFTFGWRDPSLTDNIRQSIRPQAVRSQYNCRRYHSEKLCSELFYFDILEIVTKNLRWIPQLVICAVAKGLWVVLRMTGCWQTSIQTGKIDSPWTNMKMTVPGWNSGCRVGRNRCLGLLLCAGRIQSFLWLHHLPKPDKISWQQTPVYSLEIVGQNHFITKKRKEFSNWPFNEIVKGFDEQRSAFIRETIL